jgi:type III pantothenate kinase
MLLAVDVGNTNINMGVFKGRRLVIRYAIPTSRKNYFTCLKKIFLRNKIDDVIVCSVVPGASRSLERGFRRLLGRSPYIIGKGIKVPIRNRYRNPKQVGQDRLVNAYAAVMLYGAPSVVVDFGTAITFDVISKRKEYLGGMILPGLQVSLDALAERTALLPEIKLGRPQEFIGRDTKNSLLSGVVYGFGALTDALAVRIKNKIGKNAMVIGTGGNINLMAGYCRQLDKINKDLTLCGLNLIYRQRKNML